MNIAIPLQRLLDSHKLSRSKLAREIRVHTSTVTNWLEGKEAKLENLESLCKYFGCSMDYFSGQKEKPTVTEDDELNEYLEELKTRPEMKMLFSVAKGATKEDVEKAVKIIETLLGK